MTEERQEGRRKGRNDGGKAGRTEERQEGRGKAGRTRKGRNDGGKAGLS
jgi:hypothetical protein